MYKKLEKRYLQFVVLIWFVMKLDVCDKLLYLNHKQKYIPLNHPTGQGALRARKPLWDWAPTSQQDVGLHHGAVGHGADMQRAGQEAG